MKITQWPYWILKYIGIAIISIFGQRTHKLYAKELNVCKEEVIWKGMMKGTLSCYERADLVKFLKGFAKATADLYRRSFTKFHGYEW